MTYSDIRLVSGQDYEKYVDGPDCQKPSAGRFHHDIGKAFVRESMSLDNKFCSVYLASVMVHEMWHKALGWEFNERDSDLCEGLTEYLTRETMKFVKPAILNPIELAEDKSRIARVSKCAKVCADDFIVSLSSGACLSYSYLDKMKQIESLAVYSPKEFRKFLRNVITWGQPVSEARAA